MRKPLNLNFVKRLINKISCFVIGLDEFEQRSNFGNIKADVIFPAITGMITATPLQKIFWIPDFQEQVLPHFFSKNEISVRNNSHRFIKKGKYDVVFSSQDAFNTFSNLFPKSQNRRHLLKFAVSHPNYQSLNIYELKRNYKLDKPYYFVSNQFWEHKNHMVVLRALLRLRDNREDFLIVFSGKEYDFRNPEYTKEIKEFVAKNMLTARTRFLGFIDRSEQLKLMSEAIAVIQPSFFEGWSTVVEDAKAMNQWVLASDLAVHKEQLKTNASFFSAKDDQTLANYLLTGIHEGFSKTKNTYEEFVNSFASEFMKIVLTTLKSKRVK
ncbi:MAG: hypothetical protein NVS1B13_14790 [Flavisolibacter sp.]